MLRNPFVDVLELLVPVVLAAALFLLGRHLHRWPASVRRLTIATVIGLILFVALCLLRWVAIFLDPVLYWLGGPKAVLAGLALLLLGVVFASPGRSFSTGFLRCLTGLCAFIVLVEATGSLTWRFLPSAAWDRTVDEHGCLPQSTLRTCGPAAAVMLLHRHGIEATEGEMAYLARTSFFGSDGFALSRAIDAKAASKDLSATFARTDYATLLLDPRPFVATLRYGLGAHAVFVERADAEHAHIIDPSSGDRSKVPRDHFESSWNGEMIEIPGPR